MTARDGLLLTDVHIRRAGQSLVVRDKIHIPPGCLLTLSGPSGVGKSSLLAWICGVLDPLAFSASGRITLDGRDITRLPTEQRNVGILFQDDLLFPHMTIADNLAFGLPRKTPAGRRATAITNALRESGLADIPLDSLPSRLSGGQRARISLMRLLLSGPRAILLDEPFSAMHASLRIHMRQIITDHLRTHSIPALLVSHMPEDLQQAGAHIRLAEPDHISPSESGK